MSNPDRLALTNKISQLIIDIKHIEMAQLEKAKPIYQLNKTTANKSFILLGTLNLLLLLITFIVVRPLLD